jgi:hypothetical protein
MSATASTTATEADFYPTVIEAARILGWRVAHFRPAMSKRGWRTPVQGDGKGFVDFVLVHAGAGRVWFVELKRGNAPLAPEQQQWGEALTRAGAVYRLVRCPAELPSFLQDMADTVRPM